MRKKLLLLIPVVAAMAVGVVGMSAFEAHVINVTAHIENALAVSATEIPFGTVFPQESLTQPFSISLSDSFVHQQSATDVKYVINQKLKPCPLATPEATLTPTGTETPGPTPTPSPIDPTCVPDGSRPNIDIPLEGVTGYHYLSLCPFLSKEADASTPNAVSEPSYFIPANGSTPASCIAPSPTPTPASGEFNTDSPSGVTTNNWTVDLKVPPVAGTVGQDWPASCASYTVLTDSATYGCDLWIEVTGIGPTSRPLPSESPTPSVLN